MNEHSLPLVTNLGCEHHFCDLGQKFCSQKGLATITGVFFLISDDLVAMALSPSVVKYETVRGLGHSRTH